jgi:branched-subunit amino acid ABC-type transport system permease component
VIEPEAQGIKCQLEARRYHQMASYLAFAVRELLLISRSLISISFASAIFNILSTTLWCEKTSWTLEVRNMLEDHNESALLGHQLGSLGSLHPDFWTFVAR